MTALAQAPLRIYFFDVGQGDAVLIQSPSGETVLYDAGDSPTRIVTHLAAAGVARLDLVIASHNHLDHIGGLAEVIRRYRPRFYLDNGVPATTLIYGGVINAVEETGAQLLEATERHIQLGEDTSLTILPPPGIPEWDQNDNTVGAILTYGQFRMSLGGDAEGREWDWWREQNGALLTHVQVHKASHHGSNQGDTARALAALTPEVIVISVGQNNLYRHPRPEALRLYAIGNATVYRTDVNGTVLIEVSQSGSYVIRMERGEPGRGQVPLRMFTAPSPLR